MADNVLGSLTPALQRGCAANPDAWSPSLMFWRPRRAPARRSANRLLTDVLSPVWTSVNCRGPRDVEEVEQVRGGRSEKVPHRVSLHYRLWGTGDLRDVENPYREAHRDG